MPNQELATTQQTVANRNVVSMPIASTTMEKVLIQGDLSKLDAAERVAYYRAVCESIGLNPLTKPFDYITLQGKTVLYALRSCTEQLRQIHNVSISVTSRECVEGCYIVTAKAVMPNQRQDESIGAVSIEGLKGESRANAMMKAETKAKRRVTLSICGLAFLDESEADSVRGAQHVSINTETGEMPPLEPGADLHADIVDHPPKEKKPKGTTPFDILEHFAAQKKRFTSIGAEPAYYAILNKWGVQKSNQFPATEEGRRQARGCFKELQLMASDLEVIPVVDKLPDAEEFSVGKMLRCGGKFWSVIGGQEHHEWAEAK